jgi:CubicO group peptidase (beta-lactamase class C family)
MISSLLLLLSWTSGAPQSEVADAVARTVAPWRREHAPGGAVAVLVDGELVASECFGLADIAAQRPNEPDTAFYVASLAKPFTAACAMHAAARGALDLDAPVTKLVPELPEAYSAATLRHALHHRSGILDVYDVSIAADLGRGPVQTNAAAVALLARLPQLSFVPGTRMVYSNSGYVLLAEAIARATGRDLAAYAREHLFGPTGMEHAHFLGDPELKNAALSYVPDGAEWIRQDVLTGLRGPGGLYLALDDLVAFELAWRAGTWGDAALRSALSKAPAGWQHPRLGPYAAGWMLQELDGQRAERHSGGGFGFSADLLRFHDHGVSVIVLSNAGDLDALALSNQVARAVLPALGVRSGATPREAIELTPEQRSRFGRLWRDAQSGEVWIVTPRPDHLQIAALGDLKLELVAESATRLVARDAQAPFAVELEDGALLVRWSDGSSAHLEPMPFPPLDLLPVEEYAGAYVHVGLDATIRLEAVGDQLALVQHEPLLEVPPFLALAPDLFVCEKGARIDFQRGENGRVVGLIMNVNRAWGLRFERRDGPKPRGGR